MAAKAAKTDGEAKADDGATPAPRGRKKLLLIASGAVALLLAGGGAAAYCFGVFGGGAPASATSALATSASAPPAAPILWAAPDLVVTLNTSDRKSRYLKVRTTLELAHAEDVPRVEQLTPRIIDFCQIYLRELRPDELRGSAAIVRLREELLRRINLAIAPAVARNVYFTDIFIE